MEVILADVLGYCMGVRRAVDFVENALETSSGKKVYSLGPLIHNKLALEKLQQKGLSVIQENDIDLLNQNAIVTIRAHGVSPDVIKNIESTGAMVVNATCPKVSASQRNAYKYAQMGYLVILVGDKNHGEVTGIAGYAGDSFLLIESISDAEKLQYLKQQKAVLLSQTTFNSDEFEIIAEILKPKFLELKVLNTICSATRERQEALKRLCPLVEGIIVVGGKNSANSRRLYEIAKENCSKTVFIENVEEIPKFFYKLNKVGITAGASTPDSVIRAVKESLENY